MKQPPSDALLTQWGFIPPPPPKARGRNIQSTSTDGNPQKQNVDPLTAIITLATPLVTSILTRQLNALSDVGAVPPTPPHRLKHSLDMLDSPPTSPSPLSSSSTLQHASSSPPPDVEHELEACLTSFGRAKALADGAINTAIENLSALGYTPEVLADTDITNDRVGVVSGLPEGTVSALQKFARRWCGKIDAKRARMGKVDA